LAAFAGQLTQAIRNFAKNLEGWLKNALVGTPDDIVRIKVSCCLSDESLLKMFCHSLCSYNCYAVRTVVIEVGGGTTECKLLISCNLWPCNISWVA